MSSGKPEDEALLRRLVAVLSEAARGLQPSGESASGAELLEALAVAEAAAHRVLAELRRA